MLKDDALKKGEEITALKEKVQAVKEGVAEEVLIEYEMKEWAANKIP